MLVTTCEGTVTGFGLVNPKLFGEREAVVGMLDVPANRPAAGTVDVCDKGFAGRAFEAALAGMGITVVRPARRDERDAGVFPNWLRQRIEAVIWTLKGRLGRPRRARDLRPGGAHGPAAAGAQRGDLAQLGRRSRDQAFLDRL